MFNQSILQKPGYDLAATWFSLECRFYLRITNKINTFCEHFEGILLSFDVP